MENPHFTFIKADIADRDPIYEMFEKQKPDIIVNFAAESHVDRSIDNQVFFADQCNWYRCIVGCLQKIWYSKISSSFNR